MDKLYRVEGWSITMVSSTNIIQLTRMADEYLDMSQSADVKFYEVITQNFEYIGNSVYKGLYIDKEKKHTFRFVEVDSIPKDYNEVENESEN